MKIPKSGEVGGLKSLADVTEKKRVDDDGPAVLAVGLGPSSKSNVLTGTKRTPESQTAGIHVRMRSMLGKALDFGAQIDRGLAKLVQAIDQTLAEIAQTLVPQPQLVPVMVGGGRLPAVQQTEAVRGPTVLHMASIRDMLRGAGRLLNEVPAQWRDADYDEVVAAAKKNEPGAKKAKKIAEQKNRLSQKTKGKR